jgi:hypothetical protein
MQAVFRWKEHSMKAWWGDYEIGPEETRRWQIGPMSLWVTRSEGEWRIATAEGEDPLDSRLRVAETAEEPVGDEVDAKRFAVRGDDRIVRLTPGLPDRPLIVKAARPFFVPTTQEVTLYVSSPLWLRVYTGEDGCELKDVPLDRPSDTWFGPDTMSGEMCYASQSSARMHLENLPTRHHRAISALTIRNSAGSALQFERLKVPVQCLSLFTSEEGHLWTEALQLDRREETANASVDLVRENVRTQAFVAPPRIKLEKRGLSEALGNIFGMKGD